MIKKVLVSKENEYFFVKDDSIDYHTHLGVIPKSELQKSSGTIKTLSGNELRIFTPTMHDQIRKIKRGPAIMLQKDIGYIIAETGLTKSSIVLEAGTGSGASTIVLSSLCKKVYSYENNKVHFDIATQNIEDLKIKNIVLRNKDIIDAKEKDVDLLLLDLAEPWNVLETAERCLKTGGFIATYLPSIVQVMQSVEASNKTEDIRHVKTIELMQREWHIEAVKVRPKSQMIAHTAFLSIFRKV